MSGLQQRRGGVSALPLSLIAQAVPKLSRLDLVALTERLIERLDEMDGDIDLEDDDPAGQCDEDGFNCGPGHWGGLDPFRAGGPGCHLSDGDR